MSQMPVRDTPRWESSVVLCQLPSYTHVIYMRCWEVIMRNYTKTLGFNLEKLKWVVWANYKLNLIIILLTYFFTD